MNNGADIELKRRAERRIDVFRQIDDLKAELTGFKAEDKADGYNEKALVAAIKSLLKGPEWHADQLAFELEVGVYREAVGLTTDAAAASKLALAAIGDELSDGEPETEPDDEPTHYARKSRRKETVQ